MEQEPQSSHRRWETAKGIGAMLVFGTCAVVLGGVGLEVTQDPENTNVLGTLVTDLAAVGFAAGAAREWCQLWRD